MKQVSNCHVLKKFLREKIPLPKSTRSGSSEVCGCQRGRAKCPLGCILEGICSDKIKIELFGFSEARPVFGGVNVVVASSQRGIILPLNILDSYLKQTEN